MIGKGGWRQICLGSAALLVLTLSACKVERPDTVLSDGQMEDILYDYHIARAMGEEIPHNDSYKRVLYVDAVFRKHGITEAQFDTSMVWFSRNPTVIAEIYERVNKRLKTQRDRYNNLIAIRDNRPKISPEGDSVNVWLELPHYQLTGTPFDNKLTFALTADTNYYDRDTLRWKARFHYLADAGTDTVSVPVMALQVEYEKDTTLSTLRHVKQPGMYELSLWADTFGAIKQVRGFIYYPTQLSPRTLTVDRLSLMRFHATDSLPASMRGDSAQTEASSPAPEVETRTPAPQSEHDTVKLNARRPVKLSKRQMQPL